MSDDKNKNKNKNFAKKVKEVVKSAPLKETKIKIKNKVGRKPLPKEDKKDKPVMTNFTNEEYEALKNLSAKEDRTISSLVRMAALDRINKAK